MLVRSSRRLSCLEARIRNGSQTASNTGIMIPRTNERNSSLPIAPPVPSISLLSLFLPISRHTPAPVLRCVACLHAKSTWNQFDQSCSSLFQLRHTSIRSRRRRNRKPTNTPTNRFQSLVYPLVQTTKRRCSGQHRQCFLSIAVASNCQTHDDDDDALLWPCCQRREQSPGIAHTPVVRPSASDPRAHHPGPLKPVSSVRPAQEPRPRRGMTRANAV